MSRYHTSVSLDSDTVDKIRQYGISISSFARNAIEAVLTDGFEDYLKSLKVKLVEDKLCEVREEIAACESRLSYLREQEKVLDELYVRALEEREFAMTVGKLTHLLKKLNKELIMSNFDVERVAVSARDLIVEILEINPDFSLDVHARQLQATLR